MLIKIGALWIDPQAVCAVIVKKSHPPGDVMDNGHFRASVVIKDNVWLEVAETDSYQQASDLADQYAGLINNCHQSSYSEEVK